MKRLKAKCIARRDVLLENFDDFISLLRSFLDSWCNSRLLIFLDLLNRLNR